MRLTFAPMQAASAEIVVAWTYEPPYDYYTIAPLQRAAVVAETRDPATAHYAITDEETDDLIAFCCYGRSAQVPGGDYTAAAIDIGIGLRPDLTGQGLGPAIIAAILDFAQALFIATAFRATIAAFNERSQRAFAAAGFEKSAEFTTDLDDGRRDWVIMTR